MFSLHESAKCKVFAYSNALSEHDKKAASGGAARAQYHSINISDSEH